jgi:hypothetical protein
VARKAFALALLTAAALTGCSTIKGLLPGAKEKAAEAKVVALRARTDSLRKARRLADSLAQVRFAQCADSVRAEMSKPPVAAKGRKKRKKPFVAPSEELVVTRVQSVCGSGEVLAQPRLAATDSPRAPGANTGKAAAPAPTAMPAQPVTPDAPVPLPGQTPAAAPPAAALTSDPGLAPDTAVSDSARKAKEMEMSRETFAYSGASRDPFNSLLNMAKTGPELADLQLVGIYRNLRTPDASIAVFREKDRGKRHKLRAGDQVGRSRLVQIRERDVVFMIEDFGFERQETLSLRKQEDVLP